jgi:DNA-binding CsgD family transcriptional regulator
VPTQAQHTAVTVHRSRRGFSDRDRQILELTTPYVALAVIRHQRRLTATTARYGRHLAAAADNLPNLTPRQRQVVAHVLHGASDQQIARRLAISPRTVHKHLEQVYRTLGLNSRTSLRLNSTPPRIGNRLEFDIEFDGDVGCL